MAENAFALLGQLLAAGGGGAIVCFAMMKAFGEKWLESRFAKNLEAARHTQLKDLEDHRYQIKLLVDNTTKLQQKEFEAVPNAWALLADCYVPFQRASSSFKQYPDVSRLNHEDLLKMMESREFSADEIRFVQCESDTQKALSRVIDIKELQAAGKAYWALKNHLDHTAIYMTKELDSLFREILSTIGNGLKQREFTLDPCMGGLSAWREMESVAKKAEGQFEELRDKVREQLWSKASPTR